VNAMSCLLIITVRCDGELKMGEELAVSRQGGHIDEKSVTSPFKPANGKVCRNIVPKYVESGS